MPAGSEGRAAAGGVAGVPGGVSFATTGVRPQNEAMLSMAILESAIIIICSQRKGSQIGMKLPLRDKSSSAETGRILEGLQSRNWKNRSVAVCQLAARAVSRACLEIHYRSSS